jgi:CRISPR-associated endoribonuclease Cas6
MNTKGNIGMILNSRLSVKNEGNLSFKLPVDYRRGFISIIKGAVENHSTTLFSLLFEKRTVKPYTFSVSFGNKVKIEGESINFEPPVEFKFSTNRPDILTMVYNYLVGKREFPIYNLIFKVENINISRPRRIEKDQVVFRTLSPVLIRSHKNERHYLCPECINFNGDSDFKEAIKFNLDEMVKHLSNLNETGSFEFKPVELRKLVVKHMGLKIPGFVGTFSMKASPEILNLINQVGLGSRRSQGFGMVEVIREI